MLSSYKELILIPQYVKGYMYCNSSILIDCKVDDPIFKSLMNHYIKHKILMDNTDLLKIINIINILYITFEDIKCEQNYHDILLERYPLLSKISNSSLIPEELFDDFIEYMNFKYQKSIHSD